MMMIIIASASNEWMDQRHVGLSFFFCLKIIYFDQQFSFNEL